MKIVEHSDNIFALEAFLSADECAEIISAAEREGFDSATISTAQGVKIDADIRNNDRRIVDDAALADSLWRRASGHIPPFLGGRQAIGLNERFRIYRYTAGQKFSLHVDAPFRRPNGEESLMTAMMYLNDAFVGGETGFGEIVVEAATGTALFFHHDIPHEGRAIARGVKYVLRTDVMYNPVGRVSG